MLRKLISPVITALVAMCAIAFAGGTVITAPSSLVNNSVTDAKLRDSAALSVIGRASNSIGDPADIVAASDGQVLRRSGTSLGFGTVATAGIADNAVTYAKLQDISATSRILGRISSGAGDVEELTGAQVTALLSVFNALANGLVPQPGVAAGKFLRDDGAWASPTSAAETLTYERADDGATWNKPSGAKLVEVIVIGGGGGGGGGRQGGAGTGRTGGGGGGGAFVARGLFVASDLPSSVTITVGAGGTGGAGGSSPGSGVGGGTSDFGSLLFGYGGGGGQAGQSGGTAGGGGGAGGAGNGGTGNAATNNGGAPSTVAAVGFGFQGTSGGLSPAGDAEWGGGGGGRGNVGVGAGSTGGGSSLYGGGGGGGGGQVNTSNTTQSAGGGGSSGSIALTGGGGAAGGDNASGGAGTAFGPYCGGGGGGGGAAATGTAGNGGNGYIGSGGGGGGAAGAAATAGAGGNGGNGRVIVITYR